MALTVLMDGSQERPVYDLQYIYEISCPEDPSLCGGDRNKYVNTIYKKGAPRTAEFSWNPAAPVEVLTV
jgi:hypothetical protein